MPNFEQPTTEQEPKQDIFDPDILNEKLGKIKEQGGSEQDIEAINNMIIALKDMFEETELSKSEKQKSKLQKKLEKATDSIANFLTSKWARKPENRKKAKVLLNSLRTVGVLAGIGTGLAIGAEMLMPEEAEASQQDDFDLQKECPNLKEHIESGELTL